MRKITNNTVTFNNVDKTVNNFGYSFTSKYIQGEVYNKGNHFIPNQISIIFVPPSNKYGISPNYKIKWIERPTGNCQLSCIGYFNQIFSLASAFQYNLKNFPEHNYSTEDIIACFLRYSQNVIANLRSYYLKLVLIDISQSYSKVFESFCKKYNVSIVNKNNYNSTNGSLMCTYMVKFTNFMYSDIQDIFEDLFNPIVEEPKEEPKVINNNFDFNSARPTAVRKDTHICPICENLISPGAVYRIRDVKNQKYRYFHVDCYVKNRLTFNVGESLPF